MGELHERLPEPGRAQPPPRPGRPLRSCERARCPPPRGLRRARRLWRMGREAYGRTESETGYGRDRASAERYGAGASRSYGSSSYGSGYDDRFERGADRFARRNDYGAARSYPGTWATVPRRPQPSGLRLRPRLPRRSRLRRPGLARRGSRLHRAGGRRDRLLVRRPRRRAPPRGPTASMPVAGRRATPARTTASATTSTIASPTTTTSTPRISRWR